MMLTPVYTQYLFIFLLAHGTFALFRGHRTEDTANTMRQPLAPRLFAATLQGWCLPEFLPCWAYCSSKSSQHGTRPPRSAFSPSQPQCRWHRTSRSGHRRFCAQGKKRVKCHCGLRQHPKHISCLLLCTRDF